MDKKATIIILLVVLAVIAGVWFLFMMPKPTVTTQNPGGTGNTTTTNGTTTLPDQTAGWLTYTDSENLFTFKYPQNFGANVWAPTQWPPMVTLVPAGQDPVAAGCPNLQSGTGAAVTGIPGTTPSGFAYLLYKGSDIGAGQLYSEYCYAVEGSQGYTAVIDFIIHSHSACGFGGCGAYCGTQYESECTNLDRQKDIESPIQQMVDTSMFSAVSTQGSDGKIIGLNDNNSTLELNVGETFLPKLGENYNWSVNIGDQSIVSRVMNIAVVRGAQGVYSANKPGSTDLNAVGDPLCRSSVPPCAAPSLSFVLHLKVK